MLKTIIRAFGQVGVKLAIIFIWIYQATFSKIFFLFGVRCRYHPSCSTYSKEAFVTYGLLKGLRMTLCRLVRCQPFGSGGFDPVIKNKKG